MEQKVIYFSIEELIAMSYDELKALYDVYDKVNHHPFSSSVLQDKDYLNSAYYKWTICNKWSHNKPGFQKTFKP